MVVVGMCLALSPGPASAALISFNDSPEYGCWQDPLNLGNALISDVWALRIDSLERCPGDVSGTSSREPTPVPTQVPQSDKPIESVPSEHPLLGLGALAHSGANTSSPTSSSETTVSVAIFAPSVELPIPLLLSWLKVEQCFDVPFTPPFELFRPPRVHMQCS